MDYHEKTVLLKNGKICTIRRGKESDAELLIEYLKVTAAETPYLTRTLDECDIPLEEEREIIREKNKADDALNLLAFVDGRHAGNCAFNPADDGSMLSHRCCIGIALCREFWGMGIGSALMEEILCAAKAAGYERAELEVVSDNEPAIALYRKFGFETMGTIPEGIKYKDGTYADFLFMTKRL